jgi:hypothetical protein
VVVLSVSVVVVSSGRSGFVVVSGVPVKWCLRVGYCRGMRVVLGGRTADSLLPSPCRFGCLALALEGVRRRNCVVFAYIPLELRVFPRGLSRVLWYVVGVVGLAPTNSSSSL